MNRLLLNLIRSAVIAQNRHWLNYRLANSIVGVLFALGPWTTSQAATLPSGFSETVVTNDLVKPTAMAFAPDGRLFVCQQEGALRVIKNGVLLATPFVSLFVNSLGERGLLGIAFDPNFATNQFVYLYYTTSAAPIHNRVSRFTASGDVAVPGSEVVILELESVSATNHNGGAIHFGQDGKLYVAVGENANGAYAQSVGNRLGKLLRINADGSIPADNPASFTVVNNGVSSVVTPTGENRAIWALGLRNPFSFAVQPETGDIFINDVGERTWEEINEGIAGANYGWPSTEGETTDSRFVSPLYAYGHSSECAITGGAFYKPSVNRFPREYIGSYFFADFCGGWIRRYDPVADSVTGFATGIANPVDLQVGADGSLYYLARGSNTVVRVQFSANQAPVDDFNGDGKSDLVWRHGSGVTYLWLMNGGTLIQPPIGLAVMPASQWEVVSTGDFNGDGKSDLVWRHGSGVTYLWLMNGGTLLQPPIGLAVMPAGQWEVVSTGDFNGDGRSDLVWRNTSNGIVSLWLLNGGTLLQPPIGLAVMPAGQWEVVSTGDFNGDGKCDLVWRHSSGVTYLWLLNGGTLVQPPLGLAVMPASQWEILTTGDFNGDGKSDLVWRYSTGVTYLWLLNGGTLLQAPIGLAVMPAGQWEVLSGS